MSVASGSGAHDRALLAAAIGGDSVAVGRAPQAGPDAKAADEAGQTALQLASRERQPFGAASVLLGETAQDAPGVGDAPMERGADPDRADRFGVDDAPRGLQRRPSI